MNEVAKLRQTDVVSKFNVRLNRDEDEVVPPGQKFKSSDDPVVLKIALKCVNVYFFMTNSRW